MKKNFWELLLTANLLLQNTETIYAIQQVKSLRALTRIRKFLPQEHTKRLFEA